MLLKLPPDYRRVPPGHERIPYGQLKKNWRQWKEEMGAREQSKEERRERDKDIRKTGGKGEGQKGTPPGQEKEGRTPGH
ncbi:MAG: hypothetical protein HS130_01915 [Deltaproteobacteria bacterium]|nr:hypothetical protein [Deltaproteobacteria bacterium]